MQSWTLDIQRELPFNILLDTSYVASKTNGLWTGLEDINQVDSRYLSLGNTLNADINSPEAAAAGITRPYPSFQGSVSQSKALPSVHHHLGSVPAHRLQRVPLSAGSVAKKVL